MAYELYGSIRSGSLAVELTLAEIGVAYEVHAIDLRADAQRDAAYTLVNPQQKLPALRTPEGDLLTESVAILLTLDERHPDAGLLPAPATAERAVALRWLLFISTELYPVVEINDYPERFTAPSANASATRQLARELWRRRWLVVEQQFGGAPYFLASGFSLVDIYIAVVSRWAQQEDWRPANLPSVEAVAAAVGQRPACAPIWACHELGQ